MEVIPCQKLPKRGSSSIIGNQIIIWFIGDNPVLNIEIWKNIPDFPYEVSNLGNIRRMGKSKYHSISKQGNGKYLITNLWKNNISYTKCVHRLVAEAFIPNPLNKPQVNHKDKNTINNCVENLEWVTCSENHLHAYKNGKQPSYAWLGKKMPNCSSIFHYTYWDAAKQKWMASIKYQRKNYYVGRFDNEIDAAKAADTFIKNKGWNKKLNFN